MSNKTGDKNVVNIEVIEDFILELKSFGLNKDTLEYCIKQYFAGLVEKE